MNTQVLLGTLLGDASIYKSRGKYYVFSIEHSKKQEEYLKWKAFELDVDNFNSRDRFDKRTNKCYYSVSINKTSQMFETYHQLLYRDGRKVITMDILGRLDRQGIAVWYCDDGSYYYKAKVGFHIYLAVNGFTQVERNIIITYFRETWKLNFKNTQESIRITGKQQCSRFIELFGEFIPDCMSYKKEQVC